MVKIGVFWGVFSYSFKIWEFKPTDFFLLLRVKQPKACCCLTRIYFLARTHKAHNLDTYYWKIPKFWLFFCQNCNISVPFGCMILKFFSRHLEHLSVVSQKEKICSAPIRHTFRQSYDCKFRKKHHNLEISNIWKAEICAWCVSYKILFCLARKPILRSTSHPNMVYIGWKL